MERNNFIQRINNSFARLAEWILDHRLIVVSIFIILCGGVVFSSTRMRIDLDQFAFAPAEDTEYYREILKEYGNDEFLYILYSAKQGIFDLDVLRKTRKLVEDLKEVPYVEKIHSITNIEFMESTPNGDLKVAGLMSEFPSSQEEADRIKHKLLDKPLYVNSYISKDAHYAGILCDLEDRPEDINKYQMGIWASLKSILSRPEYQEFEFRPVGNPVLNATLYELQIEDITFFSSIAMILNLSLLVLLFRQAKAIAGVFVVIGFAFVFVVGFMGICDLPMTMMFSCMFPLLVAIGLADSVHLLSEYQIHLKSGLDNRTSIIKAIKHLGFPCLFTSLTTAAGFGSLVVSPMWPTRDFGLYSAFGVLAAFIFTFTILLLILSIGGERTEKKYKGMEIKREHGFMDRALQKIASFNNRSYKKVLIVSAILTVIAIYGTTKLEVNASTLMTLGKRVKLFNDFKFVDETMGGTGNFEILMKSNKPDGAKTLQFVQTLEKIQAFADSQDHLVKKTISVIDVIKDINQSLHNNDRKYYTLPSSDEEVSQYMLLYEISGGDELEKLVSTDIAAARLTIYVKTSDAIIYKQFHDELVDFIESVKPDDYSYAITGASFLALKLLNSMGETLVKSFSLAIIVISLMMIFVFRSIKVGLISMLPNIFPILAILGFMGLSGIWLSFITTMFGSMVIGLAVDDTIHFISRYQMEFNRLGNYGKALDASLRSAGRALTITTITLVGAGGVVMFSKMDMYYYFGMLLSICLVVALLADFFVAPALILLFKPFGKEFSP